MSEGLADPFVLAGREYRSRLIVGTGKYRSFDETRRAVDASGAEIVTVAVRRVNITDPGKENLLDYLPLDRFTILPNTAGCYTAEDAVRTVRLAREAGIGTLVKLEVIGDERTLFPDVPATIEAARQLVAEGFQVLPYVTDDPVACKRLEDLGCVAVMPLAAPIGSGLRIRNPFNLRLLLQPTPTSGGRARRRRPPIARAGSARAGLARPPHEPGRRRGARPDPDGGGDAPRCRRRPQGVPRRTDPGEAARVRVEPDRRPHPLR